MCINVIPFHNRMHVVEIPVDNRKQVDVIPVDNRKQIAVMPVDKDCLLVICQLIIGRIL